MQEKGLSILDALENLNTLVDAKSLDEIEVTEDALLIPHKREEEEDLREIYWVKAGADDQTLQAIRETFRSVRDYLQGFYTKMQGASDTKRLVEGINTVMVLVGEAAKNLDRFGTLFKKRVIEFEEFKELQDFYRNQVIKESFQAFAKTPVPKKREKSKEEVLPELQKAEQELQHLLAEEEVEEIAGVHILNDLDVIKRDHLYELFYLKNEAGYNFYTYELARNIKLACDFGEFAQEYFGDDPLLQIKNWEDKSLNLLAQKLLKKTSSQMNKFYKEAMKFKEMECVAWLHQALMALMLAANPRNLIRQFSLKGSHLYFHDFLLFLRETLHNREYQKFLIYSPPSSQPFFENMLNLTHSLCYQLYTATAEDAELTNALKQIIEGKRHKSTSKLSENLIQANTALFEALQQHPNGPVFKAVDIVREEAEQVFDPLMQGNLPSKEWAIIYDHHEIDTVRVACPIWQEMIHRAEITEEFKTFLRAFKPKEHLLLMNFQDRTSWKEHARSFAIEELSKHAEFADMLTVVTLAKDTDFYNQSGLYQELDGAQQFIDHFIQHLSDEITGYYFPQKLQKTLFPKFVGEVLRQIHKTFFDKKTTLSYLERLNFIQLAYHFVELKLLEFLKPTWLCLSSKDGLDIGGTSSIGLISLLTVGKKHKWSEKELDRLYTILFGPTLMNRERVVHLERFERLISMIQLLENKGNYLQEFEPYFHKETLKWEVKV